jgi:hypothetical protein
MLPLTSARDSQPELGSAAPTRLRKAYGNLPLSFESNQGQTDGQVKFLSRGGGYTLFLTPRETVLALAARSRAGDTKRQCRLQSQASVVRMRLVGSNPAPELVGLDELPARSNYFIGSDPNKWHTNVPNYRQVAERGIYPGIDLVYYGNQRLLESDFVISPGADPRALRLALDGVRKVRTNSEGDLIVEVAGGELRLHKPVVYQPKDSRNRPGNSELTMQNSQFVDGRYVIRGKREVAFQVGKYDSSLPLVIDPILSYSTYLGGSEIDSANAIAVATDGTAFTTGGTSSSDFPTAHSLQPQTRGPRDFPQDAFVSKISADGSTLLYSTYLGGSQQDQGNGIAVDTFGNAYVVGTTVSEDYPGTEGAWDPNCSSDGHCGSTLPGRTGLVDSDGFLTKLNPAGSLIIYSGFIGGDQNDKASAVAVDTEQNAYVTGQTEFGYFADTPSCPCTTDSNGNRTCPPCAPFPTTGSALQGVPGPADVLPDAFLIKISNSGSSILYSTLFGGNGESIGNGIKVDNNGNAYVAGVTYSSDFFPVVAPPLLAGPQLLSGGNAEAFVVKINTSAFQIASDAYATYLGGDGIDQANGIALDSGGNVYVTGQTSSTSPPFPTTIGALQGTCALNTLTGVCDGDAFVTKLNPAVAGATSLVYSTYLGGTRADVGQGIDVDTAGNTYVTGFTTSGDFPTSGALLQRTYGGGNTDAFVTKLNPAGSALVYSSFLGGSNADIGYGVAVDPSGNAYVAGQTCSTDFPTLTPLQAGDHGNCDAFIAKIATGPSISVAPASLTFPAQPLATTSSPQSVTVLSTGDSPLTVSSVAITGDFGETDDCAGKSLSTATSCTINVTFTPTAAGNRNGAITIADNAPGSPHTVTLIGGTGSTFTLTASPPSVSVVAGDSVNFTLTVTPSGGFNEAVNLTCGGLPPQSSCSVSPGSVTPDGTNPVTTKVTVSTAVRSIAPPGRGPDPPPTWPIGRLWLLGAMALASLAAVARAQGRRAWVGLGATALFVTLWVGCGGGKPFTPPSGTPAGNYTVTVKGTSGAVTHSVPVTVTVR